MGDEERMSASIETYRAVNLGTTSPHRVIVQVYETGIRSLAEAEKALASGEKFEEPLGRARTVLGGLMTSLNFEAGEMSRNLLTLYLFALDRIQESSLSGQDRGLAEVRKVLEVLKSGWDGVPAEEARSHLAASRPGGFTLRG